MCCSSAIFNRKSPYFLIQFPLTCWTNSSLFIFSSFHSFSITSSFVTFYAFNSPALNPKRIIFQPFFSITADIQYYISCRCTAEWLGIRVTYEVISHTSIPPTPRVVITVSLTISRCYTLHPRDYLVTVLFDLMFQH